MTDSENESNVFNYPNGITVSAKGPTTNMSNFSLRNTLTSTFALPYIDQQRYSESVYDQRSIYNGRATSAMSMKSACDLRLHNYRQGFTGMRSQRSISHGRSGSTTSVRSIDSTASVSVADITIALRTGKFSEHEMKQIKKAYYDLTKQRSRKRIEKRRRLRKFLNACKRSEDDSGEQGSDSSLSSDDCRSIKTLPVREDMSYGNLTDLRTIKENKMNKYYNENVGLNTFRNMYSVNSRNFSNTIQNLNKPATTKNNCTLKERFQNSLILPSQRFNKSVASTIIPELFDNRHNNVNNNILPRVNHLYANKRSDNTNLINTESDEEIFSENFATNNSTNLNNIQQKRSLCEDELNLPNNKIKKLSSPNANKKKLVPFNTHNINNNNKTTNNFEFAVPTLPAKKVKAKIPEILIAKSSQPLTDLAGQVGNRIPATIEDSSEYPAVQDKSTIVHDQHETADSTVSMRPSFIKRKLFTQKLDVVDKANLSGDSTNSPQSSVYGGISKEKNKTRKLVTTSCLSRDVHDDSNLLDLIHKIVPPDHMNASNQTSLIQHTKADTNNRTKNFNNDKLDVSSVISMCNDDDVSDTFTDEEIFKCDDKEMDNNDKKSCNQNALMQSSENLKDKSKNTLKSKECFVVLGNISVKPNTKEQLLNDGQDTTTKLSGMPKNKVQNWFKSFWDTDFESDIESLASSRRTVLNENLRQGNAPQQHTDREFKARNVAPRHTQEDPKNTSIANNIAPSSSIVNNNARKLDINNLSVRSHHTSKTKKCFVDAFVNDTEHDSKTKSLTNNIKSLLRSHKENFMSRVSSKPNPQKTLKENIQTKLDEQSVTTNKKKLDTNSRKRALNVSVKSKQENTKELSNIKPKIQGKCPKDSLKQNVENVKENSKLKSNCKNTKKSTQNKNSQLKTINNSKKNVSQVAENFDNSVLSNTAESLQNSGKRDRPVRSCRILSQNISMEVSHSLQLSSNASLTRSLRSRIINLSTSIENITFNIKPKNKEINVINISQNKSRKSNVSFSLGDKSITPRKCSTRNKSKRKT